MAPLKFEDKIKEKLEQRAIEPSESSWEKLSEQLDDTQDQKKGNTRIWWYSLAAVFVGILIMSSLFYKNPASKDADPQFVDRSEEKMKQNETELVQKNNIEQKRIQKIENETFENKQIKSKELVTLTNKETAKKEKNVNLQKSKSDDSITRDAIEKKKETAKIAQNRKEAIDFPKQEKVVSISPEVIDSKIADVVAQVEELQKNNTKVTDEEIDRLLRKAQRDITTQKILKSKTVSASALLQDVEEEIDETFKQRVFEALKTGFQKVKTAVAEREN